MKPIKMMTCIIGLLFAISALATTASFTPEQTKAIEKIVHNYLVNHPEVLVEASQALQHKQRQSMEKQALNAIPEVADLLFYGKNTPVAGDKSGAISLVEFFDYRCPHCKEMTPILKELMKQQPNLRVVFKEWPIFGGASLFAARAALASQKQGKYVEFHNALMASPRGMDSKMVISIAKKVGLNVKQLEIDMKSPEINQQINNDYKVANQLGLQGTPAFIIAKTPVEGSKPTTESLDASFIPGATTLETLQQKISKIK